MVDNFSKFILLTPDAIFSGLTDINSEGLEDILQDCIKLRDVFKTREEKRDCIFSLVEIQNPIFDFITMEILLAKGQVELVSHLHIISESRKLILHLKWSEFDNYLTEYLDLFTDKKESLILELKKITEELDSISALQK